MAASQPQSSPGLSALIEQAAQRAAASFADILNLPVSVQLSRAEQDAQAQAPVLGAQDGRPWGKAIHIHFEDDVSGDALFLLPAGDEVRLLAALFAQNPSLSEVENASEVILLEIGNVLLNACVGTISNRMGWHIQYQVPLSIAGPEIAEILNPGPYGPTHLLRMLSTLGVGEIKINATLILIFYTQVSGLE
jgi:hypothetical protein